MLLVLKLLQVLTVKMRGRLGQANQLPGFSSSLKLEGGTQFGLLTIVV